MKVVETPGRALIDETVSRLEHLIFSGELKPGEKLSEQALSSRFGISRGPLREAIRSLDLPPLIGVTLFGAFFIVLFNTIVDVLYAFLDPRIRLGEAAPA